MTEKHRFSHVGQRRGNRYTQPMMTQREADTINRCVAKLSTLLKQFDRRGVYIVRQQELMKAIAVLQKSVRESNRELR